MIYLHMSVFKANERMVVIFISEEARLWQLSKEMFVKLFYSAIFYVLVFASERICYNK